MPKTEVFEGRTPRGGVRTKVIYLDSARNLCEKDKAVHCEIIEYDVHGKVVRRSYGTMTESKSSVQEEEE
jgi:hypothetical protein